MRKIMVVFGTRPEAIKMCPLVKQLKNTREIECKVCSTGQHREMLDQVMKTFDVNADYDLDIMRLEQSLSSITVAILKELTPILENEKPDMVLVHGDTTTSFAAALTSFYQGILVGHVEAGLRTYDMKSPYPEEFNRQAVDLMTNLYFAPTEPAREHLIREGKNAEKIIVTGNTVIDSLLATIDKEYTSSDLEWAKEGRLIIFTAHRRENIGQPMQNMFCAIKRIAEEYSDVRVIYPVHKNPKVYNLANEILSNHDRIRLVDPLEVGDFHNYMARSYLILTDSGGVQEEAPALGIPVLVMRDTTERPEGVDAGTLKLVGTDKDMIYSETKRLLDDRKSYEKMSKAVNPYGDGMASKRIVDAILSYFNENDT